MTFPELLLAAIRRSEIPLRFEPGAEEAVAKPVTELIRVWLEAHEQADPELIRQLTAELEGRVDVAGT
jgi:hypothetical protein